MKARHLFIFIGLTLGPWLAQAASAPASVADSIIILDQQTAAFAGGSTIWLKGDGTYAYLAFSQSDVFVPTLPSGGTYSYAPSPATAAQGTLTLGSGNNFVLSFNAPTSGSIVSPAGLGPLYNTFVLSPAIVSNAAVNVSNGSWVTPTQSATTGFVISGSSSRWVLIRAVGTGLQAFGVPVTLTKPTLRLYSGETLIGSFGSWSTPAALVPALQAVFAMAGAFPLTVGIGDCAAFMQLGPGAYTMVCSDQTESGQELSEVYILPY